MYVYIYMRKIQSYVRDSKQMGAKVVLGSTPGSSQKVRSINFSLWISKATPSMLGTPPPYFFFSLTTHTQPLTRTTSNLHTDGPGGHRGVGWERRRIRGEGDPAVDLKTDLAWFPDVLVYSILLLFFQHVCALSPFYFYICRPLPFLFSF